MAGNFIGTLRAKCLSKHVSTSVSNSSVDETFAFSFDIRWLLNDVLNFASKNLFPNAAGDGETLLSILVDVSSSMQFECSIVNSDAIHQPNVVGNQKGSKRTRKSPGKSSIQKNVNFLTN